MAKQVHTLGDARDVGLEIVVVCGNLFCRRRTTLDLHKLIYQLGEGRSVLPEKGKAHFSEKLKCSACGHVGAFLWPREQKGPEPYFKGLSYAVNEWYSGNGTPMMTVAKVSHVIVAHATFESATKEYPNRRITLQQGSFVLRDSRLTVFRGGKA
jgi:hypothetical protein